MLLNCDIQMILHFQKEINVIIEKKKKKKKIK